MDPSADQLRQWDKHHVWHAFTQMAEYEPFIIERAEGCWLYDLDGKRYLDGVSSLWCNVHGHRHPVIDQAIREQLEKVAHVTSLGMSNPTTIRLAERLARITPAGLNHVFFSDSGATAVEVALKMAFQFWRQCETPKPDKTKYIALQLAYHGDTIGSNSVGGIAQFHELFDPLLFDVVRGPCPDMYRLPTGIRPAAACDYYLDQIEQLINDHHEQVAALVMEPMMQGAAGMIAHPEGFLSGVRRLTQEHNVLLIADEVAVGFGRTGRMFACECENVVPDIICLAKGITGGYLPVAATLATTEVWKAFLGEYSESRTLFHGHTYGGNPLGAAAALATLDVFEQEQTLEKLPPKIERLHQHLDRIAQLEHVGDVRQRGMMAGIELVKDRTTKQPFPWQEAWGAQVCFNARRRGVAIRPLGNVVVVMPPLAISLDELDQICVAIEQSIIEVMTESITQT